jgi:hypothetical protein
LIHALFSGQKTGSSQKKGNEVNWCHSLLTGHGV